MPWQRTRDTPVTMSIGDFFATTAFSGSMLLAIPIALIAGLVAFASPCVLPLVPGYLGFVGGLAASSSGDKPGAPPSRKRVFLGVFLFIAGFTTVFVAAGVLTGVVGTALNQWMDPIIRVLGVVVIIMGLAFMGAVPVLQTDRRMGLVKVGTSTSLWGAPALGFVFGLGWTPCLGPTLIAINSLALSEGSALRGAILAAIYSLGLGLPFLIMGLGLQSNKKTLAFLRKHRVTIMRLGGGMLILIGLALVSGLWTKLSGMLTLWIGGTVTVV